MAQSGPAQVGVPVSKANLDAKIGAAADGLRKANRALQELVDWAAPYSAEDLVTLYGYTDQEANLFLSMLRAPTDAPAVAATVDGLAWINRAWGP